MAIDSGTFSVAPSFDHYFLSRKNAPLPDGLQKWKALYKPTDLFIIASCHVEKYTEIGQADVVLVIDGSGSMIEENRWVWVQESLLSPEGFCGQLRPDDRIGLVVFNHELSYKTDSLVPAAEAKDAITRLFYMHRPGGQTRSEVGLEAGLHLLKSAGRKDAVQRLVFLSDGQNYPDTDASDTQSYMIAEKCGASEIDFYTIGYGLNYEEKFMEELSTHGGANAKNVSVRSVTDATKEFAGAFSDTRKVFAKNPTFVARNRNEELFEWVGYRMIYPVIRKNDRGPSREDWRVPLGGLTEPNNIVLFHLRLREDLIQDVQAEAVVSVAEFEFSTRSLKVDLTVHPKNVTRPLPNQHFPGNPQRQVFIQAVYSHLPNIREELCEVKNLHPERRQDLVALGLEILQGKYENDAARNQPEYLETLEFFRNQSHGKMPTLEERNIITTSTRSVGDKDKRMAEILPDTAKVVKIASSEAAETGTPSNAETATRQAHEFRRRGGRRVRG